VFDSPESIVANNQPSDIQLAWTLTFYRCDRIKFHAKLDEVGQDQTRQCDGLFIRPSKRRVQHKKFPLRGPNSNEESAVLAFSGFGRVAVLGESRASHHCWQTARAKIALLSRPPSNRILEQRRPRCRRACLQTLVVGSDQPPKQS